jgi:hypothetical protein
MTDTSFTAHGFTIDLDLLYRAMYDRSEIGADGRRVFHGNKKGVRAVKRLLNDLFEVPVQDTIHPVNNAFCAESRDRLKDLGWAINAPGGSARYVLYRELGNPR